jgi:hypothetical protein
MLRFTGEVLLMRGGRATEESESCFRAPTEFARAQEARWELLRTVGLARLLAKQDHREKRA